MRTKFILTVLSIFHYVLVSGQSKINDTLNTKTIVDIEVATFKYLFDNNASSLKESATVYYLEINDSTNRTLSSVLTELLKVNPKVKDIKEFRALTKEEKANLKFLLFRIDTIIFKKRNAIVSCGYFEGSLSSSGNVITLAKKRRRWRVLSDEMLWISVIPIEKEKLLFQSRLNISFDDIKERTTTANSTYNSWWVKCELVDTKRYVQIDETH